MAVTRAWCSIPRRRSNVLDYVLDKVDMMLLMSVNPGFGGQKFIPSALAKLTKAREMNRASGREIRLEIDGGVKVDNIGEIAARGRRHVRRGLGDLRLEGLSRRRSPTMRARDRARRRSKRLKAQRPLVRPLLVLFLVLIVEVIVVVIVVIIARLSA